MSTTAVEPVQTEAEKPHLARWALLIGSGVFATTLAQPAVLKLPFQNLLKAGLGVSRAQMAAFFSLVGLAWYAKPILGIFVDSVPLFGTRRRHYMLLGSSLAAAAWLAIPFAPHKYLPILIVTAIMNLMLVIGSTVVGALMVEGGQKFGASGRLSSARYFVQQFCNLVGGPLGGFLAAKAFGWSALTGACIALSVFPFAFIMIREPRIAQTNHESIEKSVAQLKTLVRSGTLWAAAGMLFLIYIMPGFQTPLYYFQTDTLKFSQQFIGILTSIQGGAGMIGALIYGMLCRKIPLRRLMYFSVSVNAFFTLSYLFYRSATLAVFIDAQYGFVFTLAELVMMDLAVRATPKGCEAMGFALMMSIRNLALIGISDVAGSWMMDKYHITFFNLVWINSGTTALVLFAIPFLPGVLVDRSDSVVT
jgi:hypothetical protein